MTDFMEDYADEDQEDKHDNNGLLFSDVSDDYDLLPSSTSSRISTMTTLKKPSSPIVVDLTKDDDDEDEDKNEDEAPSNEMEEVDDDEELHDTRDEFDFTNNPHHDTVTTKDDLEWMDLQSDIELKETMLESLFSKISQLNQELDLERYVYSH